MATYCISDIHGCFDEFMEMLDKINFQESDELYILGDIIDRGPKVAEMLWWAMKEAPANIHFLLGNHEDMMLAANHYFDANKGIQVPFSRPWSWNGSIQTIEQIKNFDKWSWEWEEEIINWAKSLPLYYDIKVDGDRFILVHAALQSKQGWPDDFVDFGNTSTVHIDGFDVPQNAQAMLWNRLDWLFDEYEWPFDIVCGHTPVIASILKEFLAFGIDSHQPHENGIVHFGPGFRKHLIDCGVNKGGKLACFRLDDFEEFYVEGSKND